MQFKLVRYDFHTVHVGSDQEIWNSKVMTFPDDMKKINMLLAIRLDLQHKGEKQRGRVELEDATEADYEAYLEFLQMQEGDPYDYARSIKCNSPGIDH